MTKPYMDFELSIQPEGESYRSRVLRAPAGEASGVFSPPFSEMEVENFLLRIGGRRRVMRRIDSPEAQAARSFGERLFRAAFPEEVRDCLRVSLDAADGQGAGLRIRLRLNEVPELADLPWEYLWDPSHRRFLALSASTPIVRYIEVPERIRPLEVKPPLRILAMISSPAGYESLDVEQEWIRLREALSEMIGRGLVILDRLEQPTLMSLRRRLRQTEYHIFHFIGHGGVDPYSQESVLVVEDQNGRARLVDGQSLSTLLRDRTTLRLVVLNACEGARATRTDPFAGTAQSLVQGSLPAAIAMQFEISDSAAITFASEFYQSIAEGLPIDAALAEARLAIFAQDNGLEWGTPVLYLRATNGKIFDLDGSFSASAPPLVKEFVIGAPSQGDLPSVAAYANLGNATESLGTNREAPGIDSLPEIEHLLEDSPQSRSISKSRDLESDSLEEAIETKQEAPAIEPFLMAETAEREPIPGDPSSAQDLSSASAAEKPVFIYGQRYSSSLHWLGSRKKQ